MTVSKTTRKKLAIASVFSTVWLALVVISDLVGHKVNLLSGDLMTVWVAYFAVAGATSYVLLMKMAKGPPRTSIMMVPVAAGLALVCAIYPLHDAAPHIFLALLFGVLGYLFAVAIRSDRLLQPDSGHSADDPK